MLQLCLIFFPLLIHFALYLTSLCKFKRANNIVSIARLLVKKNNNHCVKKNNNHCVKKNKKHCVLNKK